MKTATEEATVTRGDEMFDGQRPIIGRDWTLGLNEQVEYLADGVGRR